MPFQINEITNLNIDQLKIAILIPCYNEELSIHQVIQDIKMILASAQIYVFDNNSTDKTAEIAATAGCHVIHVGLKGKGNVVRRMFADVEADIYVMVDGDATYDITSLPFMITKLITEHLDMVVGVRKEKNQANVYRHGHRFGNKLLTRTVHKIFGGCFTDMLSGYRIFSRRYVKSFPALSRGFEIETELTIHALELRMPYADVPTPYSARHNGSVSKLSTYKDGLCILNTIIRLYMSERPLACFGLIGFGCIGLALIIASPIISEYLTSGLVPRLPSAVLAAAMVLSGLLSFVCGLILETVTRGRNEIKRLIYLSIPKIN